MPPPEHLETPPWPAGHVWYWFLDLHAERRAGFGPEAISSGQIETYGRVMRLDIRPWEAQAIRGIDRVWLQSTGKRTRKKASAAPQDPADPAGVAEGIKAHFRALMAQGGAAPAAPQPVRGRRAPKGTARA